MNNELYPTSGEYDPYEPTAPEVLRSFLVKSENDLPQGYELLYQEDRILERTPDGRTTLDVLLEIHGQTIKLVPAGSGYRIYKFIGLKAVE